MTVHKISSIKKESPFNVIQSSKIYN